MTRLPLCRFSLSMPGNLVGQLDAMCDAKGYGSRSQAVADMVRDALVEHRAQSGSRVIAGTITLVYDHHKRDIQQRLTRIQHDHGPLVISTLHVHLDHHNCMEVLAVRGAVKTVRTLADRLIAVKGIKHGKLTVTTTGAEFQR